MTDIVERLQRGVDTTEPPDKTDYVMREAADEIMRLRKRLEDRDRNAWWWQKR